MATKGKRITVGFDGNDLVDSVDGVTAIKIGMDKPQVENLRVQEDLMFDPSIPSGNSVWYLVPRTSPSEESLKALRDAVLGGDGASFVDPDKDTKFE